MTVRGHDMHDGISSARVLDDVHQELADGLKYQNSLLFRNRNVVTIHLNRDTQLTLGHLFAQPLERGHETKFLQNRRTQLRDKRS